MLTNTTFIADECNAYSSVKYLIKENNEKKIIFELANDLHV